MLIPSFMIISPLVLEKNIFHRVLILYGHDGYIGHVTKFILINFHFFVPKIFVLNLITNGPVVSEKNKF